MGRLRRGERLIDEILMKGGSVFPPLPPTKILHKNCTGQLTLKNAESNVSYPTKKKQKRVSSLSILGKNESDNVPVDVDESGLLSRLCPFPIMTSKNKSSLRLLRRHASQADSVRKALVSDLMSHDTLDVESMVGKANEAFTSLSLLRNDFGDLYNAVRAFIAHHCQLSEANKELENLLEMIARRDNLLARSNGKAKALSGCETALNEAKKNVVVLVDRIKETRALLKELEEKLSQGDVEIDALKEEHDKLKDAFEDSKAEHENVAKEVKEKQKIVEKMKSQCDMARVGIDKTKVLLSSLC